MLFALMYAECYKKIPQAQRRPHASCCTQFVLKPAPTARTAASRHKLRPPTHFTAQDFALSAKYSGLCHFWGTSYPLSRSFLIPLVRGAYPSGARFLRPREAVMEPRLLSRKSSKDRPPFKLRFLQSQALHKHQILLFFPAKQSSSHEGRLHHGMKRAIGVYKRGEDHWPVLFGISDALGAFWFAHGPKTYRRLQVLPFAQSFTERKNKINDKGRYYKQALGFVFSNAAG